MPVVSHIPTSSFSHFDSPRLVQSASGTPLKGDLSHLAPYMAKPSLDRFSASTVNVTTPNKDAAAIIPHGTWATDKLCRLGMYHPVEPAHATFPKAQLALVLDQLTDCFRALSCHVLYEDNLLSAACLSPEQVEFQVTLFETAQPAAHEETILMELQRRAGDSFVFHQDYVRPIMAVIQGNAPVAGILTERKRPDRRAGESMDHLSQQIVGFAALPLHEDDVTVALELATNLVTADRLDARRLGMESLATMLDTSKTGWSTACQVARALILPTNDNAQRLAQTLLRYLLERPAVPTEASKHPFDEDHLAFEALNVWSHAWQVGADDLDTPLEHFCDVACPADALCQALMDRVVAVHARPHAATLALQALCPLCKEMPQLRAHVSWADVQVAEAVGVRENAALAKASRQLLNVR